MFSLNNPEFDDANIKIPMIRRAHTQPLLGKTSSSDRLMRKVSSKRIIISEKEVYQLAQILEAEDSHLRQWRKHLLAALSFFGNIVVVWLRGAQSPLSLSKCGFASWTIFALFVVFMLGLSYIGVLINKGEQGLKTRVGRGLVSSDIRFNGS